MSLHESAHARLCRLALRQQAASGVKSSTYTVPASPWVMCRISWRTARSRRRGGRASLTRRSRCLRRPALPWPRAASGACSCTRCVLGLPHAWSCQRRRRGVRQPARCPGLQAATAGEVDSACSRTRFFPLTRERARWLLCHLAPGFALPARLKFCKPCCQLLRRRSR